MKPTTRNDFPQASPVNQHRRRVVSALAATPLLGFPAIVRAQATPLPIGLTVPPGTSPQVRSPLNKYRTCSQGLMAC